LSRRALALAAVLLCAAAGGVFLLRGPLAVRVMRRVAERTLAADGIAALPDGLHVVLCGAGSPLPDPERSGACTAVIAGRSLFVVDAGSGARNLMPMGLAPGPLAALFLTHFHSDHIDLLGQLAMLRWTNGAHEAPLPVFGPPGVEEVVEGFDAAYRRDSAYRAEHHGPAIAPPGGAGLTARPFPLPEVGAAVVVFEADGVRVTAFAVDHEPVVPAVGYRFDYAGRSVVVSGDTRKSAEVLRMAKGVDLLVHEALSPELVAVLDEAARTAGRANVAQILRDIPGYHTTPVEAAQTAEAAGARHLLYTHVVPALPLPGLDAEFLRGVSDAYSGGVTLGRDGTQVSLPRGNVEIEVSER
jgi:ribonuclease Z